MPVEQVEAYDSTDTPPYPTGYAPVNFNNMSSITLGPGDYGGGFGGITFHNAVPGSDPVNTESGHALAVARYFYNQGTVAYPFVTDVYCAQADNFVNNIVLAQNDVSDGGPVPLPFQGGAKVICNPYIDAGTSGQILDLQRRIDFMAATNDSVVVAGAVTAMTDYGPSWGIWSSFDTLAVSGVQAFDPAGSPGKQHADLYYNGDASYGTGVVSGAATAVIGTAEAAGQTDATHAAVVRSLLMTGADKGSDYVRQTANNLDLTTGAGYIDDNASLSILANGEKPLLPLTAGNTTSGAITNNPKGWGYGTVQPGARSALLINAPVAITGVTASLNWDVTCNQPTPDTIDTTDAGLIFPNLSVELVPVTQTGTAYTLGPAQTNANLSSGLAGDNVQYLYFTGTLPAGKYALVVTGDPALASAFGLSYVLRGSFATNWNSSTGGSWGSAGDWTGGIPDAQAAVANLGDVSGLHGPVTITLDGNRTVGRLNFTAAGAAYTVAPGTGGTLTIDDTGDSSGIANPSINVSAGSHTVTAPVSLVSGVSVNVARTGSLDLFGSITGTGGLTKTGPGLLLLGGVNSFGDLSVNGGTVSVAASATLSGALNVSNGSSVVFAPGIGSTPLVRTLTGLNVSNATVSIGDPATTAGRTLLVTGGLSIPATTGTNGGGATAAGTLDIGANDLDIIQGNLADITGLVASGYNLTGGGNWTGPGITSSDAAADPTHLAALGVVQNNQSGTPLFTAANTFDTDTPGPGDVLVKYTLVGDANLDGVVDGSDYSLIDAGYASNGLLTGWYNGDFNYDGVIDGSDYALIDNAFNNQSTEGSASEIAAVATAIAPAVPVPEPAAVATALAAAIAVMSVRQPRPRHRRN